MDKYNIAVLVDAKQEYTHQLIQLLTPHIYVGIKSIYEAANDYCKTTGDKHVLRKFQQLLSEVPKWNTDRIDNEYARIKTLTECDWMDDLITAVFVSHTKVLTAIQLKNKQKKSIELNVPTGEHFVHKCYTEVARAFWKRPYLMNHSLPNIEIQRNLADGEQLIKDAIHETVRRMLPVRHILKEYLGNDYNEEHLDNDEDITSQLSVNTRNNLRRLVQQEIEQTLSKGGDDVQSHAPSSLNAKSELIDEVTDTKDTADIKDRIRNEVREELEAKVDSLTVAPNDADEKGSLETILSNVDRNDDHNDVTDVTAVTVDDGLLSDDIKSDGDIEPIQRQTTDLKLVNEPVSTESGNHSLSENSDEIAMHDDTKNIDIYATTRSSASSKADVVQIIKDGLAEDEVKVDSRDNEDSAIKPNVSLQIGDDHTGGITSLEAELRSRIAENESIGSSRDETRSNKQTRNDEIYDLFSTSSISRTSVRKSDTSSISSKASLTSAPKKTATILPRSSLQLQERSGSSLSSGGSFSFFDDACERP